MISFLEKYFNNVISFFEYINKLFTETIPEFIGYIFELLFQWIAVYTMKGINIVIDLISGFVHYVDDARLPFFVDFRNYWSSIPHDALQLISFFNVNIAIGILLSALAIRVIRCRIPFLG